MLESINFINDPLFITLIMLGATILMFAFNVFRMDVIALIILTLFPLTGILSVQEVLSGFSDPNIILIALLFIIGESIVRTGVAYKFSEILIKISNNNETKVLIFLMLFVATIGAFMSSTGIVAIFIPVVLLICQKMNISPRRLMMPLSMAGLISGMMTLIATPPNLVSNAELIKKTNGAFKIEFFDFTLIGIVILILGILYNLTFVKYLFKDSETEIQSNKNNHSIHDLITDYGLNDKLKRFVVKKGSILIGKRIEELKLRKDYKINVLAIERWKAFQPIFINATGKNEIREKDILLIDLNNLELEIKAFENEFNLEEGDLKENHFSEQAKSIGLIELTFSPESDYLGQNVVEIQLRNQYGVNLIAIQRNNEIIKENVAEEKIQKGDLLLVIGDWKNINILRNNPNFFLLSYPEDVNKAIISPEKIWISLGCLGGMVAMMVTGIVPNVIAAFITILLLGLFKCIDAKSSYNSIHWSSIILIVGMIPFSIALQKTGGIDLLVKYIIEHVGQASPYILLGSLFTLTAIIGLFISNTATAILMAPVAIELAQQLNHSPLQFTMVVAIAASAAFMTPVSSPVNTMVVNAGNYKFMDFVKVGVPFTILVGFVTTFLIPFLFK